MKKDRIFVSKKSTKRFEFNKTVVDVFDDMIDRSVPFYQEIQQLIGQLAGRFVQDHTTVYDLGCSTGNTLALLLQKLAGRPVNFIGVDYSQEMLNKAQQKLGIKGQKHLVELRQHDLTKHFELTNSSFVILNLVLQFLPKSKRLMLLKNVYKGIKRGGVVVVIEKIEPETVGLRSLFVDFYYDLKRQNGYSEAEIKHKAQALKNVLLLNTPQQNQQLLIAAGFKTVDPFFQWCNFMGFIGIKGASLL